MEEKKIKYGLLHCHSENSQYDSALKVTELIRIAKEMGAPAVTLTDHGTMSGIDDFLSAAKENGINGIPGVEAYIKEDNDLSRRHLILLAKDEAGYHAISKAVTDSNRRIFSTRVKEYPCMNQEILNKYFGPDAEGHGHVIATSACVAGVLASILLANKEIDVEIEKQKKKLSTLEFNPTDSSYERNKKRLEDLENMLADAVVKRDELKKLSEQKFAKKEKAVAALIDLPEYEERLSALEKEKEESRKAKEILPDVKAAIAKAKKETTLLKKKIKEFEEKAEQFFKLRDAILELEKGKRSDEELSMATKKAALEYQSLFGSGNFYVEVQYHGIPDEAECMPKLVQIAEELNIPIVAANDVHVGRNTPEDFRARQILRSIPLLTLGMYSESSPYDEELYIKSDEELEKSLLYIMPRGTALMAIQNVGKIMDACHVELSKTPHYPKFIPEVAGETADAALERMAREGIEWRFPNKEGWDDVHEARLRRELKVIQDMGYSDYHLIVKDFLEYGRLLGRLPKEEIEGATYDKAELKNYLEQKGYDVGQGIGPGRGSAVGSLVCYLLGITAMDPLKYDLLFERFLNVERVSLPDIDSDFSPTLRDKVIAYVRNKYGQDSVTCIMTKGTQAAKGAIRTCARMLGMEKYNDKLALLNLGDTLAKAIPNGVGIKLKDYTENHWEDEDGNRYDKDPKTKGSRYVTGLREQYKDNPDAIEILKDALRIEGTFTQYGMHAAGVIISDGKPVSDYVPLMWDNVNETWKTQCDMVQAEEHGLLKMDFLGLRNLAIITDAAMLIKKRKRIHLDMERLPMEPIVFEKIFAEGKTNSVFQFEGSGMKKLLKQFKPTCFEDIILLVAAYRPQINGAFNVNHITHGCLFS